MLPLITRHWSVLVVHCSFPAEDVSELKGRCMSLDVLEGLDHKFKITVKVHTCKKNVAGLLDLFREGIPTVDPSLGQRGNSDPK